MIDPQFKPYVDAALVYAGGTHEFSDVEAMVEAGTAQFWPGVHSCIVTQIDYQPRRRVLNIFLAGGNLAEIEAMTPLVLRYGYDQGCTAATFTGRKGWERTFLGRTGWSMEMVMFAKALTETEYGQSKRED